MKRVNPNEVSFSFEKSPIPEPRNSITKPISPTIRIGYKNGLSVFRMKPETDIHRRNANCHCLKGVFMKRIVLTLLSVLLLTTSVWAAPSARVLPVVLHSADDLGFLSDGIKAVVASTFESRSIASSEIADFDVHSTVTVFGNTAVLQLRVVRKSDNTTILDRKKAGSRDDVLPSAIHFADAAAAAILGEPIPPAQPMVPPLPQSIPAPSAAPSPASTGTALPVLKTLPLNDTRVVGLSWADVDPDAAPELLILEPKKLQIRESLEDPKPVLIPLATYETALSLDTADLDGDGKMEIAITMKNDRSGKLRSRIYRISKDGMIEKTASMRRFFRSIPERKGTTLLSQRRGSGERVFSGSVETVRLDGMSPVFEKTDAFGPDLFSRIQGTFQGEGDRLLTRENAPLSLEDTEGRTLWSSRDDYNASPRFVTYTNNLDKKDKLGHHYLPTRALPYRKGVLAIRNADSSRGLFGRVRAFSTGEIHLLEWNGYEMAASSRTPLFDGYIADMTFLPQDTRNPARLLVATVQGGGVSLKKAQSRLILLQLP